MVSIVNIRHSTPGGIFPGFDSHTGGVDMGDISGASSDCMLTSHKGFSNMKNYTPDNR